MRTGMYDRRHNTLEASSDPEEDVVDKDRILKYMEQLGKAVTDCLNESDEVKSMIKLLEEAGLNLNLSFVAMISGAKPLAFPVSWAGSARKLKFEITPEDREFLQGLGIKYDDERVEESPAGEETREMGGSDEEEEDEEEE